MRKALGILALTLLALVAGAAGPVVNSIVATSCGANNWINAIAATGGATCAQPATTNLSDASTGTWTPTVIGTSTVGSTQTYSGQTGSYEKIGRTVILRFNVIVSSIGDAAGNTRIGGLPLAQVNTASEQGYC